MKTSLTLRPRLLRAMVLRAMVPPTVWDYSGEHQVTEVNGRASEGSTSGDFSDLRRRGRWMDAGRSDEAILSGP